MRVGSGGGELPSPRVSHTPPSPPAVSSSRAATARPTPCPQPGGNHARDALGVRGGIIGVQCVPEPNEIDEEGAAGWFYSGRRGK